MTRSSKRAPRVMSRSDFCIAATAGTVPCMPGMPRFWGSESGNAPIAFRVVTTGAPMSLASLLELFGSTCADQATADVEDGALGFGDELSCFVDLLGVTAGDGGVAAQLQVPQECRGIPSCRPVRPW